MKNTFSMPALFTLAGIGLVMFLFVWLMPPMADNFLFSRDMRPGFAEFFAGAPISGLEPLSLRAAFRQAWEMYFTWCGRFTGNLMVYLAFLLPRWLYALAASAGFCLYLVILLACVYGRRWAQYITPGRLAGIFALLWLGIPAFGSAFFWLCVGGETALLGQAAILLPYRFLLDDSGGGEKTENIARRAAACALFFLAAVFVASLDYATSAALPLTGICCALWLRFGPAGKAGGRSGKRSFPWLAASGACGLCAGGALTILAPGNGQRLMITADPSVHEYMRAGWGERIAGWLCHLPDAVFLQWLPLLLVFFSCAVIRRARGGGWWRDIPPAAWLFALPAALTHVAYLFTAWPPPRAFATSSVLLAVAGCILLQKAYPFIKGRGKKAFRLGCAALGALACLSVAVEGWRCLLAHEAHREREEIFSAGRGRDVLVEPMPVRGNGYMVLGKYLSDIEADPDFWVNRGVAAHYHLASVALRQQAFNIMGPPGLPGFSATLKGLSFAVRDDAPGAPPEALHVYYYGTPGLLDCLPGFAGDFIYGWLAAGKDGDPRFLLVPLLCARADIALDKSGQGRAKLFGLIDAAKGMWLVRPGAGSLSFDLLRLEAVPERD